MTAWEPHTVTCTCVFDHSFLYNLGFCDETIARYWYTSSVLVYCRSRLECEEQADYIKLLLKAPLQHQLQSKQENTRHETLLAKRVLQQIQRIQSRSGIVSGRRDQVFPMVKELLSQNRSDRTCLLPLNHASTQTDQLVTPKHTSWVEITRTDYSPVISALNFNFMVQGNNQPSSYLR